MRSERNTWAFFLPWALTDRGGVNQVVLHLLAECDYQPLLVEGDWEAQGETRRFGYPTVRERVRDPLAGGFIRYLVRLSDTVGRLWRLVRKHGVTVVNAHFPGTEVISFLLLRRLCGFKLILSFHGSDIREALGSRGLKRAAFRWMLRRSDAVVACSRGLLGEIEMLEPRMRKAAVVPNGVDPVGPPKTLPIQEREDGTELIVTVGRFEERKGHDVLLASFGKVLKCRPRARLWMIGGQGKELDTTRRLAAEFGDRVTVFVDVPHSQVMATVAQADVFAFASRWRKGEMGEGLPIAVLEAGVLGLPVVSTRCCGAEEVIDDGKSGVLVQLEDADALAAGILGLLEDRTRAKQMGAALQQKILKDFQWRQAWRLYRDLAA